MKGRGNPHLFTPLLKGMSQGLPPLCYYEKDATLLLPVIARVPKGLLSLSCKEGGNPDDAILHSLVIARSAPSFCHCEEGRSPDEAISLRGFLTLGCPPCPSLRVRTEVLPPPVIARKDGNPSEAISLFPYFWKCYTIAPQLPEIATGHSVALAMTKGKGPRNDKRKRPSQ